MRIAFAIGLCLVAAVLASCSDPSSPSGSSPSGSTAAASSAASDAVADAPPAHNWNYKDGLEYGYEGALSDDDKKAGKAAADVSMFRYLGEHDGIYTLENDDGLTATCTNPCEVIKIGGGVQHMAFSPDSIIGAAFTDAFNGQLEVYRDLDAERAAAEARAAASDAAMVASEPPAESAVAPMNK